MGNAFKNILLRFLLVARFLVLIWTLNLSMPAYLADFSVWTLNLSMPAYLADFSVWNPDQMTHAFLSEINVRRKKL